LDGRLPKEFPGLNQLPQGAEDDPQFHSPFEEQTTRPMMTMCICIPVTRKVILRENSRLSQSIAHDLLRFADDGLQVRDIVKTFRIYLVNVFCAGGPCGEPAALGYHL
jgi:hypothetical protein